MPDIPSGKVREIIVWMPNYPAQQIAYRIGDCDITRIEIVNKEGMYSYIPYVRVWQGDKLFAEFCQHNLVGVWFEVSDA